MSPIWLHSLFACFFQDIYLLPSWFPLKLGKPRGQYLLFIFLSLPTPQKSWGNLYKYKRHIQRNHLLKGELSTCDKWSGGRLRQGDYCKGNRRQSKQANDLALSFLARNHDESQSTLFSLFIKGNTEIPEEKHQWFAWIYVSKPMTGPRISPKAYIILGALSHMSVLVYGRI